jgi:hypothetical protein
MSSHGSSLWLTIRLVMMVIEYITTLKSNREDICVLLWNRFSSSSFEKAKKNSASVSIFPLLTEEVLGQVFLLDRGDAVTLGVGGMRTAE